MKRVRISRKHGSHIRLAQHATNPGISTAEYMRALLEHITDDELERVHMQFFNFNTEKNEYHWFIPRAIAIAETKEVHTFAIDSVSHKLESGDIQIDNPEYAMLTNLSKPVIIVPLEGAECVIDGWHRIYHAWRIGVRDLPCVMLTEKESRLCLLPNEMMYRMMRLQKMVNEKIANGG